MPTKTNVCLRCGVVQQKEVNKPNPESITKLKGEVEDLKRRLEHAERKSAAEQKNHQEIHPPMSFDAGDRQQLTQRRQVTTERTARNTAVSNCETSFSRGMSTKQIVGIIGASVVFVGCFLPIATLPIVGSFSYLFSPRGGLGDGILVAALALVGLFAAVRGKSTLLLIASVFAAIVLGATVFRLSGILNEFQSEDGLAGAILSTVRIGSGVAVMTLGLVAMFVAALMSEKT